MRIRFRLLLSLSGCRYFMLWWDKFIFWNNFTSNFFREFMAATATQLVWCDCDGSTKLLILMWVTWCFTQFAWYAAWYKNNYQQCFKALREPEQKKVRQSEPRPYLSFTLKFSKSSIYKILWPNSVCAITIIPTTKRFRSLRCILPIVSIFD